MTGLDRADLDAVRSLEHHSERPAAQLAQGRTFADRENNPPRRMLEEAVPVEGRAVGEPVWPTGENGSDGKRDVLGGGACAKGDADAGRDGHFARGQRKWCAQQFENAFRDVNRLIRRGEIIQ